MYVSISRLLFEAIAVQLALTQVAYLRELIFELGLPSPPTYKLSASDARRRKRSAADELPVRVGGFFVLFWRGPPVGDTSLVSPSAFRLLGL